MQEKAEHVGTINHVFRYTDQQEHNVVQNIGVSELDLEASTEYIITVDINGGRGGNETVLETAVNTNKEATQVSLPHEDIEKTEAIAPGRTAILKVYTVEEDDVADGLSDNTSVIARTTVKADPSSSDDCYSLLHDKSVAEFLSGTSKKLQFRNTRTMQESVAECHSDYERRGHFTFPSEVRESIGAQPDDLIEIIASSDGESTSPDEQDVESLIREMHGMMMEMYNDYMELQNE